MRCYYRIAYIRDGLKISCFIARFRIGKTEICVRFDDHFGVVFHITTAHANNRSICDIDP